MVQSCGVPDRFNLSRQRCINDPFFDAGPLEPEVIEHLVPR